MSPLLTTIIAAGVLVILQFLLSARSSEETRRIYKYLLQDARHRAKRSFTVIVPLQRRADTLFPLLDHLYSHGYDRLQVIVLVKQTAGSKAVADLEAYRRKYRRKALKIVRHKRGMTDAVIAKTHTRNQYLLTLAPDDRLSPRFFEITSQVLVVTSCEALAVRDLVRPTRTFAQAFRSLASLLRMTGAASTGTVLPTKHAIVRRQAVRNEVAIAPLTYAPQQVYSTTVNDGIASSRLSWASLVVTTSVGLIFLAVYLTMAYFLDTATAQLYMGIIAIAIELGLLLCPLQFRGYRLIDYLNFVLFIPLAPLFALFEILRRLIARAYQGVTTAARRRQLSTQR